MYLSSHLASYHITLTRTILTTLSAQGVMGVADVLKSESEAVLKGLKALGMDVWMITGDNPTTAEAIGKYGYEIWVWV
ncbi:HAD family hydrolase [archaeon]|nr:MAG: HAD family hydrolase [archaeon]